MSSRPPDLNGIDIGVLTHVCNEIHQHVAWPLDISGGIFQDNLSMQNAELRYDLPCSLCITLEAFWLAKYFSSLTGTRATVHLQSFVNGLIQDHRNLGVYIVQSQAPT